MTFCRKCSAKLSILNMTLWKNRISMKHILSFSITWVLKYKTSKNKKAVKKKNHESSILLGHHCAFDNSKELNYLSWNQKVFLSLFNCKWEKITDQFNWPYFLFYPNPASKFYFSFCWNDFETLCFPSLIL